MSFNELLETVLAVFKDWRFIVTIIAMLAVVIIANKIVNYKKRPKRPKRNKKNQKPAPAPKPVEKKEDEEVDEDE